MDAGRKIIGDDPVPHVLAFGACDATGAEVDERGDTGVRTHLAERADRLRIAHHPHDHVDR